MLSDEEKPEHEEPKSPVVIKNRPGEQGSKLPSIDSPDVSTSNLKKI